jgi:hypothetical protein
MVLLPNRKWFLPPYKANGILQAFRFYYYYQFYLKNLLANTPQAIIITFINGQFLTPFSSYIKQKSKLPLISFFHDDILELNFYNNKNSLINNTSKVLEASDKVLVVSEAFKNNWGKYAHKFSLLYPIPERYDGSIKSKPPNNKIITFGYSGAIYDEIIPCLLLFAEALKKLNHRLIIIGNKKKTLHIQAQYPDTVSCLDMFNTPNEASIFLVKNCNAAIITYPQHIDKMPWVVTCYPSKFLQYCQLNLPTIIFAPSNSAIGKWCTDHKWRLYSNNYDISSITNLLEKINDESVKNEVRSLKNTDFDPGKIHNQLKQIIKGLV